MVTSNFNQVKNITKGCPRRSLLYLNDIAGKLQYYAVRKKYLKQKITDYIVDKFDIDEPAQEYDQDNEFDTRIKSEQVDTTAAIWGNLDAMIKKHNITITTLKQSFAYESDDIEAINVTLDGIGTFEGDDALFKIVPTTRFSREFAWELILAQKALQQDIKYRLIVLKLGNGTFREVFKLGDRNKNGSPSKRQGALGPWENLRTEAEKMIKEGRGILSNMDENPTKFNIPQFSSCGTCPFHNYTVKFNGDDITCSG